MTAAFVLTILVSEPVKFFPSAIVMAMHILVNLRSAMVVVIVSIYVPSCPLPLTQTKISLIEELGEKWRRG
jgi:hypothetical protein